MKKKTPKKYQKIFKSNLSKIVRSRYKSEVQQNSIQNIEMV